MMEFIINGKKVASSVYYPNYAEYIFYDKNGYKIASFVSEVEMTREQLIAEFGDDQQPKKREEFMW